MQIQRPDPTFFKNWGAGDYVAWAAYEWGSDMKDPASQYFEMKNDKIQHGWFQMMMGYDGYHSPARGFIEKYSINRWCSNKGLGSGSGGY